MSIFKPDLMVHSIMDIQPSDLQDRGIQAMILDADNTLSVHGSAIPYNGVPDWIQTMKAANISMLIASNNTQQRIHPLAQNLGLEYRYMSLKPLPFIFCSARKTFGVPRKKIAVIGDQLFTDIVGGHLAGMMTILVEPFEMETGMLALFKRKLEAPLIRRYRKHQTRNGGR